jgi:uncharacterized repeat protein (TIGR01451 family)
MKRSAVQFALAVGMLVLCASVAALPAAAQSGPTEAPIPTFAPIPTEAPVPTAALFPTEPPVPGLPTVTDILSAGPLNRVAVSTQLNCQVGHVGDEDFEFYDGFSELGACGTLLSLGGTLYGPSELPAGPGGQQTYTLVSQSPVSGSGSESDPLVVTTVVNAGPSMRLTEIDSYVVGRESYRTDIQMENTGGAPAGGILYRAADCYLQNSDTGIGRIDAGAPACVASSDPGARIEQWLPVTPGSHAYAGPYGQNWQYIVDQQQFPDRCDCDTEVDDGAGISWGFNLAPGESATFSHLTLFSPAGRRAVTTTLASDTTAPPPGGTATFTATVRNPDTADLTLSGVHADLPAGMEYVSGSSSGGVSGDPAISDGRLSWTGPFSVPTGGQFVFSFAARSTGTAPAATVTAGADPADATTTATDGAVSVTLAGGTPEVPLRSSVPSPTQLNLDPVVLAQTAVLAVGVVVLIPFPSALFNSTLEQNYDEIVGGFRRRRKQLLAAFQGPPAGAPPREPGDHLIGFVRPWLPDGEIPEEQADLESDLEAASEIAAGPGGETVDVPSPAMEAAEVASDAPAEPVSVYAEIAPELVALAAEETSEAAESPEVDEALTKSAASDASFWTTNVGIVSFLLASALLYGLLDPTFGFDLPSLSTFLGIFIGLVVLLIAFGFAFERDMRRNRVLVLPRALPGTIVVGIFCVLISRVANFQPGYLYGLVIGFLLSRELAHKEEGRGMAIATTATLIVTGIAWLSLIALRAAEPATGAPPLYLTTAETASVTLTVAGIEMALFAMLPLRFMPGEAVFHWNRAVWVALVCLGAFGFFLVLVNPQNGYMADSTRDSFFTMVALLATFGLASVAFWAYFRFRARRGPEPPSEEALI